MKKNLLFLIAVFCFIQGNLFAWPFNSETTVNGAADADIDKNSVVWEEHSSNPSTPPANNIKVFAKDLAGKPVTFKVQVKAVSEAALPPLNEEFSKRFNVTSLAALRKEVTSNMERELEFTLKNRFKMQLMAELLKENSITPLSSRRMGTRPLPSY